MLQSPSDRAVPAAAQLGADAEGPLYRGAMFWAVAGILYNVAEGIVSTWMGLADETLALFGFGVDSFIEAASAVAIAVMIVRVWRSPHAPRGRFESAALRVTGVCFYLLAAGLVVGAALNLWQGRSPESTLAGVIIAAISIAVMWIMLAAKLRIGRRLASDAIVADARCTLVCIYMSVVLLASSGIYEITAALGYPVGYVDSLGALAIAWFSYREGVESMGKAAGQDACCC